MKFFHAAALVLGILFLGGLLLIVTSKVHDAVILAASPVHVWCSLIKSEDGETDVGIQLQSGKDPLRSVYLALDSKPLLYGSYRLTYGPLKSRSTMLRTEVFKYPRRVDDVSCWVIQAVYEDGRKWNAPYRGPYLP